MLPSAHAMQNLRSIIIVHPNSIIANHIKYILQPKHINSILSLRARH